MELKCIKWPLNKLTPEERKEALEMIAELKEPMITINGVLLSSLSSEQQSEIKRKVTKVWSDATKFQISLLTEKLNA